MKCIIHIGAPKTGTTSLQNYLNNPENLSGSNITYASSGRKFGEKFFNRTIGLLPRLYPLDQQPTQMMLHVGLGAGDDRQKYSRQFDKELESETLGLDQDATVIFSDEELFTFTTKEICRQLFALLERHFESIEILAYLRSPVSYVSSAYVQSIRMGNQSSSKEFAEKLINDTLYLDVLSNWADAFGKERLRIEWYDGTDIVGRFAKRLDLKEPSDADLRHRNPSLSSTAVEVLHHVNKEGLTSCSCNCCCAAYAKKSEARSGPSPGNWPTT